MIWRSCRQDEFVWAQFGEDFVVYHRPSGKTHFLNAASHLLLTSLLSNPRSFESILDNFGAEVASEDEAPYSAEMNSMLHRLEHLGLIERV